MAYMSKRHSEADASRRSVLRKWLVRAAVATGLLLVWTSAYFALRRAGVLVYDYHPCDSEFFWEIGTRKVVRVPGYRSWFPAQYVAFQPLARLEEALVDREGRLPGLGCRSVRP